MDSIDVYSFEDANGEEFGSFTTTDIDEAKLYARENSLKLIANTFEWADSSAVEDCTGGVSAAVLDAAREAVGNEDIRRGEVIDAISEHEDLSTPQLRQRLRIKLKAFARSGGRGVDLADRIDSLRMALAAREVNA